MIHRENKLIKRVIGMEKKLKLLEEALHIQKKNQKKKEKKKKIMKKKKKKHQRLTRVLNSAVKIRTLILEEDIT